MLVVSTVLQFVEPTCTMPMFGLGVLLAGLVVGLVQASGVVVWSVRLGFLGSCALLASALQSLGATARCLLARLVHGA